VRRPGTAGQAEYAQSMWRSSSSFLLYVDLRRHRANLLKGWLQKSLTVHGARHKLRRAACCHNRHIGHADKAQDRLQIRINEVQRARRSSRLIDSATGSEDRGLLAMEQPLRPALGINEGAPAANDLIHP